MSISIAANTGNYIPTRIERGWNVQSADLFLIEGSTEYPWKNLPQEQDEWTPAESSQECPTSINEQTEEIGPNN